METITQTTTLVLSYAGALHACYNNAISLEELENAVYYPGCTREHVTDPTAEKTEMIHAHYNDRVGVEVVYDTVRTAMLKADTHGRVAWSERYGKRSWAGLNELLSRNDLPVINSNRPSGESYEPLAVTTAISQQQLPYHVIGCR